MKILFLTPQYLPHIGGVEKHISEVIAHFPPEYSVTIITARNNKTDPEHEKIDRADVWRMPTQTKKSIWSWLAHHLFLLREADVIHIHDVFFWILPFRLLFFWKKMYMTFHGYEAPGPIRLKHILWHQCAELCTDKNICVGSFHQNVYDVEPTLITYGGVTPTEKTKKRKKKSILFVGRLDEDTGILRYMKAVLLLQLQGDAYHLDIFGDGPLKKTLEKYISDYQLDAMLHGAVSDVDERFALYEIAFASQYLSILQALSAGTQVIAFADSAMKHEYLDSAPFSFWISIASTVQGIADAVRDQNDFAEEPIVNWARGETWKKVSDLYLQVWKA